MRRMSSKTLMRAVLVVIVTGTASMTPSLAWAGKAYEKKLAGLAAQVDEMKKAVRALDSAMYALGEKSDGRVLSEINGNLADIGRAEKSLRQWNREMNKYCDEPDPVAAMEKAMNEGDSLNEPLKENVQALAVNVAQLQKDGIAVVKATKEKADQSKRIAEKRTALYGQIVKVGELNNSIRSTVVDMLYGYDTDQDDGEINCLVLDQIDEDLRPYLDEAIRKRKARQ